jgi:hypothetical protein
MANASIEQIVATVGAGMGFAVADILGRNKTKKLSFARHVAMYLSSKFGTIDGRMRSTTMIGMAFNGRDHTTALNSIGIIARSIKENPDIADVVQRLWSRLELEASEFPPFKSAAQSAMVFVSGVIQPFPAPDNLAGRAGNAAPSHSFSQVRPCIGFRPSTTRADGLPPPQSKAAYRAGGQI